MMTRMMLVATLALLLPAFATPVSTTRATPGPAAPPAAEAPYCQTAQLHGSVGGQNSGAGSIYTTLVLRNTGCRTCTLRGYPGVSLVDRQYRQIGRPARWDAGAVLSIALRPGDAASTSIRSLNPGVGTTDCSPPSVALRVYPPGERGALLVPARLSECLGVLNVKPLVSGGAGLPSDISRWRGVDWRRVAGGDVDCHLPGLGLESPVVRYHDVTGDGFPDPFVALRCRTGDSSAFDQLEVFDGASDPTNPRRLGILIRAPLSHDYPVAIQTGMKIESLSFAGSLVTIVGKMYEPRDSVACPSISATQTDTWSGAAFDRGPITTRRGAPCD